MPHPHDATFGLDTGGFAQPGLYESFQGLSNISPALALALQQYQTQGAITQQGISAGATMGASANQAAASAYAAQVSAAGGVTQQNIQSGTAASIANAGNYAMLIAAMGGDQNAAFALQASLGLEASISNQGMQQNILSALSKTGLRNQSQANAWMRGFGPQPGFGSAGNYWLNSVQPIAAPQVQYSPYDLSLLPTPQATQASIPSFSAPTFNAGGSVSGGNLGGIGPQFTDIYNQLQDTLGPLELQFGNALADKPPNQPAPAGTQWVKNAAGYWQAKPTSVMPPGSPYSGVPIQQFAHGGKIKVGQTALVGEKGPEIARNTKSGLEIIPLNNFRGGFHTGTQPHEPHDAWVDKFLAEQNPPVSTTKFTAGGGPVTQETPAQKSMREIAERAARNQPSFFSRPTPTGAVDPVPPDDTIGIPTGEEPVVEPTTEPLRTDPRTGLPVNDVPAPIGNEIVDAPPGLSPSGQTSFSYDPSKDISGTGKTALGLPGIQALLGDVPQGFPGDQTFEVSQLGLSGLPGPAQGAALFRPGVLTQEEKNDIIDLMVMGGYTPLTIMEIMDAFTPGKPSPFAALSF